MIIYLKFAPLQFYKQLDFFDMYRFLIFAAFLTLLNMNFDVCSLNFSQGNLDFFSIVILSITIEESEKAG